MAKQQSQFKDASSEVIQENILKQNPDGLPDVSTGLVISNEIPDYRKGVFLNGRDPGISLEFHYHSKTHPLKHYTLHHGQEVDLPVEVIDHLENCAENVYAYKPGYSGHPEMYVKSKKYIFQVKASKKQYAA